MPRLTARLIGRDHEADLLHAVVDRALSGEPALAVIVGEPGIGKTTLADEVARRARRQGVRVLRGEAEEMTRKPLGLWSSVRWALHVEAGDAALTPADRRWEQLGLLASTLASAAPALVVLEDLHWADETSVWLLERLPRELADAPIAFIATHRDQEPGAPGFEALHRIAQVLTLTGLDAEAVGQLAGALGADDVDAEALRSRTGGNPLFVRELVSSPDPDRPSRAVQEVLRRSLRRFDNQTRRALGAAAVAGAETPVAVLARALGLSTAELVNVLGGATEAGVLAPAATSGFRFRHWLFAQAARDELDSDWVRHLHSRLAEAWGAVGTLAASAAAVTHRLSGTTAEEDVEAAARDALDVAAALRSADDHGRAVGVLTHARDATERALGPPGLRAQVLAALADVLWWLGNADAALDSFESAAALASDGDDAVLLAEAEAGAARRAAPFVSDPARLRRLENALERLGPGDDRLRVELLGRWAVVAGADPDGVDEGHRQADHAVAMARRLGDGELLIGAMIDRHQVPLGPEGLQSRARCAEEIVELGERLGRADLALRGHEWRFMERLDTGDLAGAHAALERIDFLAGLLPSPAWRYTAVARRATLHCVDGNRLAALDTIDEAAAIGALTDPPMAVTRREMSARVSVMVLFGVRDPALEPLYEELKGMILHLAVPFLQVRLAVGAAALGDRRVAEQAVSRYGRDPERIARSAEGSGTLRMLGELVADLEASEHAPSLRQALLPYSARLGIGHGLDIGLPVDDLLGRLALLEGDLEAAVDHAEQAVALARSMPSPSLLVHCLDHLADASRAAADAATAGAARDEAVRVAQRVGVVRSQTSPESAEVADGAPRRPATLRRLGDGSWHFSSPLGEARVAHTAGMAQLARLLGAPGRELPAIELATAWSGHMAPDLGPVLDERAKREYRRRLVDLRAEIDEAQSFNDPLRAERSRDELDALMSELRHAVGLGGRDRPSGSAAERARVNVTRSLRRAIGAVGGSAPDLRRHLEVSVRTGRFCSYAPEPAAALAWTVQA